MKKRSLVMMIVVLVVTMVCSVSYAKTANEIAEELIFGTWVNPKTDEIVYKFDRNNYIIKYIDKVNPMEETFVHGMIKTDFGWMEGGTALTLVTLETDSNGKQYYQMQLGIRRNSNGVMMNDGRWETKLVKVYNR